MSIGISKRQLVNPANIGNSSGNKILGVPILNHVPVTGDGIYFHQPTWDVGMGGFPTRSYRYDGNGTGSTAIDNFGTRTNILQSGTGTANKATATDCPILANQNAVASANSNGFCEGSSLGTNTGIFNRYRARLKMLTTGANTRVWIGLCQGVGLTVLGTTNFVTNTPAVAFIGFRWSAGTDVNFAAIVTNGSSQSTVDTGKAPDLTQSHVFEFAYDGTNIYFYYDANLVATINSNIPTPSSTLGNSALYAACIYDNRNVAVNSGIGFATMRITDLS